VSDERAAAAERQGEDPPPWQPPGWQPVADPTVPPYAAPPGWQPPPPPYGAPAYQSYGPPPAYPPPTVAGYPQPYGYQPYGGYPRPRDTNGFAIASLVCALVGIFALVIGPVLGVVFGIVALRQLDRSASGGRGLAIAGIVIGGILLVVDVVGIVGLAVGGSGSSGGGLTTMASVSRLAAI
jgi:hypothetical protein